MKTVVVVFDRYEEGSAKVVKRNYHLEKNCKTNVGE